MKKYEIMYILKSSLDDAARKAEIEKLHGILTANGGKIANVNEWGLRELAYEIEHMRKGYYVWMLVEANNEAINEFNRVVGYNEKVIRHIVVKDGE